MPKKFIVNKEKCIGCGTCVAVCSDGAKMEDDGKAIITDSEKIGVCGGSSICPYEAIEETSE